ncbi:MAG: cytochrome c biogenesis protein CcsA [Sterolibacterium sp.]|nr:cytochrome c biogenesis protein CcsA [Sterolibacterium sp.]MBP9799189.1 cytochrome c biogenesis protein CcsA [Sterolibacterium sp.]
MSILLHLLAAAAYLGLAAHFWRTRWQGPALDQPSVGLCYWERGVLLATLTAHGIALAQDIFTDGSMRFGFAVSLSMMFWLAIALYWIESFYARMEGLQIFGFPLAALCILLPLVMPSPHLQADTDSPGFRAHFIMAMLSYSLFTLAALHSLLMAAAERSLHKGRLPPLLAGLPPLLTMEALLFRLIHMAFVLLTLTLLTGILFSEDMFGKPMAFDHKTVFALVSWLIFAALLLGRYLRGWRGKVALRWTLAGFATLLLAYVGSHFVVEVILHRSI